MYPEQTMGMLKHCYGIYSQVQEGCTEGRETARIMTEGVLIGLSTICPKEVTDLINDPIRLETFHNLMRTQMWLNEWIDHPSEDNEEKFKSRYNDYRRYADQQDASLVQAINNHLAEITYFESPSYKQTIGDLEKYRLLVDCASISTFTTLLFGLTEEDFIPFSANPTKYEHMYMDFCEMQDTPRKKVEYILLNLVMASQLCDDRYGYYKDRKEKLPTSFTHFLEICNNDFEAAVKLCKSVEKVYYRRAKKAGLAGHLIVANGCINPACQLFIKYLDKFSVRTADKLRPSRDITPMSINLRSENS